LIALPMRRDWLPSALLLFGVAAVVVLALAHTEAIRGRAEAALGRGMPPREAELARGFVLGEDDRIDPATVEDFRRSGLSHLLAVSGQNVALLALLAMPVLGAFGLPLRARLVWVLGLIAVYVPLAGADPSIQRAGIMGALSVLATLGGRRSSRFHALAVAAIVTLAVNPRIASEIGWQLSFAALLGILLLAAPLRHAIAAKIGPGGWRLALAEAAAMTVSATLATAPLIAFHFGTLSTTTLFANLLALPAVAPAMWLGMLAAAGGQVPGFPVEAFNSLNAPLLAYVAQVAAWCGRPRWASLELDVGTGGLIATYLSIALAVWVAARLRRLRRIAAQRTAKTAVGPEVSTFWTSRFRWRNLRRRMAAPVVAAGLVAIALLCTGAQGGADALGHPPAGLRVSVLDVGQGDAILLQPAGGDAILVDGGPPGAELAAKLQAAGVERLAAAVLTHDQSDHAGGIDELSGAIAVEKLLYAVVDGDSLATARATGMVSRRIAAGSEVRSGGLRLEVLWPPRELLGGSQSAEDPNRLALVLLLRWRDFSMLLSADAEAEATPLDPGPLDVLKVAHHGSEDVGLGGLLGRTGPSLAVISVGEDNAFGHPTAATLATLAAHGVRTLRTDRDGTVVLEVRRGSFQVSASD
jgi:competence protein ComEC